ncbi:MAG TPA: DUF2256 domain-containing protein [Myxococcota bacterium]|nr:DUF2256 domain-containing protein [Myxococcota bacterium]
MRRVKKQHLPEKRCAGCGRPMRWRRRWAAVWEEVRFCSQRCRRSRRVRGAGSHQALT